PPRRKASLARGLRRRRRALQELPELAEMEATGRGDGARGQPAARRRARPRRPCAEARSAARGSSAARRSSAAPGRAATSPPARRRHPPPPPLPPTRAADPAGGHDELPPMSPRTFSIGDIHGETAHLFKLLSCLPKLTADDTLVFLGDYLDRGPQSKDVIEY